MEKLRMSAVRAQSESPRNQPETPVNLPRVIAPHIPVARDIVALYAARVASTGADVLPALRNRRASFPTTAEPVIGYLAASMPTLGCPVPVGRGTATHRQALDALAASQWATRPGWLPEPERVRVTRAASGIGGARRSAPATDQMVPRPGLAGRLMAAWSAFSRSTAEPEADYYESGRRLETQTA